MANITVQGDRYKVVESMGFNHDIGMYAKVVETPEGEKVAVKHHGGMWRFWTARDRLSGGRASKITGQ